MISVKKELYKLFNRKPAETPEPVAPPAPPELIAALTALEALNKKQTDISLQVEEIYDLINDGLLNEKENTAGSAAAAIIDAEKRRADQLLKAVIGLSDILEDFYVYGMQSGNESLTSQAALMWKNAGGVLEECAVARVGEAGQALNPSLHTVRAAAMSQYPREYVERVLSSGYRYMGTVIRKAAVVISTGAAIREAASLQKEE